MSFKQLKLISGEEIICEIVYWPDEKTNDQTMVIRCAVELVMHEDIEEAIRFYTFRPYMMYIHDHEQLITLNGNNVTSMTIPADEIIRQYRNHIKLLQKEFPNNTDSDQPDVVKFTPRYH